MTRVERVWPEATVVLLGSGPSLCAEDVDYVRGKAKVIAINSSVTLAPWADCLFGADAKWWRWVSGAPDFQGLKYSVESRAQKFGPDVQVLECRRGSNFEHEPDKLGTPSKGLSNSGYLAMNLAAHLGASEILLLGYDMCRGPKGSHFFGEHPDRIHPPLAAFALGFLKIVDPLRALGISAINCSRTTVLSAFPRVPLREALPC